MPARLERDGEKLVLNLSGHPDFRAALDRVKRLPGRQYDPDGRFGHEKRWLFPANEAMALRIMHTVQPEPDAAVRSWLREAATRAADDLAAALPSPSSVELFWPRGADLFDFQRPMVQVMTETERYICGDDMGLGKTIESIGSVEEWLERGRASARDPRAVSKGFDPALFRARADKPRLVIAATSKLGDWVDELEKWAPGQDIEAVPGDMTAAKRRRALAAFERSAKGGWLIVNHEQIRATPADKEARARDTEWCPREPWFFERDYLALIADEAHRFKNPNAQQTRGLMLLESRLCYLLTGTPIINSPDELWAPLAVIRPDLYGERGGPGVATYWQFYFTYVESYPVEGRGRVVTGVKNPEELRFELSDKLGRRSKRLLIELGLLPPKLPTRYRHVPMRRAQAKLYRETETSFWLEFERDVAAAREQAALGLIENEVTEEDKSHNEAVIAAQAAVKRVERGASRGEGVEKVVRFLPNAAAKYAVLRQIATSPAVVDRSLPDESGKLDAVVEDILDHEGQQFIVFTHHRRAAELVAERLNRRRVVAEYLHGETAYLERTEIVRRFNEGETQVVVATMKTGGEGLNLTAASTVYFAEQDETVTGNDQAESRAHRIGQTERVQPIVLRSEGTVEVDRQAPRLRMKELILSAVVGREFEEQEEDDAGTDA